MFKEGMIVRALRNDTLCCKGEVAMVRVCTKDGELALDFGEFASECRVPVCYFDFKNFEIIRKGVDE